MYFSTFLSMLAISQAWYMHPYTRNVYIYASSYTLCLLHQTLKGMGDEVCHLCLPYSVKKADHLKITSKPQHHYRWQKSFRSNKQTEKLGITSKTHITGHLQLSLQMTYCLPF